MVPCEFLILGDENAAAELLQQPSARDLQYRSVRSLQEALALVAIDPLRYRGIVLAAPEQAKSEAHLFAESLPLLEAVPDGLVLLDDRGQIQWANRAFRELIRTDSVEGKRFESVLAHSYPERQQTVSRMSVSAGGSGQRVTIATDGSRYLQIMVVPICSACPDERAALVIAKDITAEHVYREKLRAVHRAGSELATLTPDALAEMDVAQRIEFLKSQILRHTKDILHLDAIEIRLLDRTTGRLEPLLCYGMDQSAAERPLYARAEGNGVTGYVAATGRSYLCEDTARDPLYLPGAPGAKSSITVPLVLHDEIIGTLNVEAPEPGRFTPDDVLFLELYARDVARGLRTLELLQAEKLSATSESVDMISREVTLPVDAIIRDVTVLLDRYIGHDTELRERLQRTLAAAREVRSIIQRVGERVAPTDAATLDRVRPSRHPLLMGKSVLIVDADETVREQSHALLERYGCVVETAATAHEALAMARVGEYDVFIADIRLPDMKGFDLFMKLRELRPHTPVILMTEFTYDADHTILRARRHGLPAALYKPFRIDRLIAAIETALTTDTCRPPQHGDQPTG